LLGTGAAHAGAPYGEAARIFFDAHSSKNSFIDVGGADLIFAAGWGVVAFVDSPTSK
jgi:hypothetical protein